MARNLHVRGQHVISRPQSEVSRQAQATVEHRPRLDTQVITIAAGDTEAPHIHGLSFLADGRLVLIDSRNKCIKFTKSNNYREVLRHQLDHEPRGVTSTSVRGEIFVTFYYTFEVKKFHIDEGNNVVSNDSFRVREKPFCISFSRNTLAIEIGEGDDGAILITDMTGMELQKISGLGRNFGMFNGNTIRLAHDHDATCFFVADIANSCINCVDYSGDLKWTVKMKEQPRGIAVFENNLAVACKANHTVYLVEQVTGKFRLLLSAEDKLYNPRFIACDPFNKKIAVEIGNGIVSIYNGVCM